MVFGQTHWDELRRDGYTTVSGAIAAGPCARRSKRPIG